MTTKPDVAGGSLSNTRIRQVSSPSDELTKCSLPATPSSAVVQRAQAWLIYWTDNRPAEFRNPVCDDAERLVRGLLEEVEKWQEIADERMKGWNEATSAAQKAEAACVALLEQVEDEKLTHRLEVARLTVERDQAVADSGELRAIETLVSDCVEVGCYAKVDALYAKLDALLSGGYVQHKALCVAARAQKRRSGHVPTCTCDLTKLLASSGTEE